MNSELITKIIDSINECIITDENFGIAFSGGIDSSLLAKVSDDLYKDKVILLSIGFPFSHDLEFSRKIAHELHMKHIIYEIQNEEFNRIARNVIDNLECNNISHIENCIAFYFISRLSLQNNCKLVLTANGFDELFCGYDKYRQIILDGEKCVKSFMAKRIINELTLVNELIKISKEFHINIKQPFLSQKFINYAMKIPIEEKIHGPSDYLRKHILREIAVSLNVPIESAMKPKKALQYGTMIHKNLTKIMDTNQDIKTKLMTKIKH
ncbi:MAG TPA: asparagine synthase C-terminal domain-containing protein [Nitrososphaeraceae archaeon]|nr:asparagine synthase C-terminal domain-containing protein [Nitrososphaeraceae archaeon]